jgi:hypothetical protein
MSVPKGTRLVRVGTSSDDAVHIYSNGYQIWLQIRRKVPTERAIAKPSFKVALNLTPAQAVAIANELQTAAKRKPPTSTAKAKKPAQPKAHAAATH